MCTCVFSRTGGTPSNGDHGFRWEEGQVSPQILFTFYF